MKHLLALAAAVVAALAGCDRWRTCEELADWAIPFERKNGFMPHEGAQGMIARAADGTLLVAPDDVFGDVQLGDLGISGRMLVKISSTGELAGIAPTPNLAMGVRFLGGDAAGNVIVLEGANSGLQLHSYGPDLQRRWTYPRSGTDKPAVDVGADGTIAFAMMNTLGFGVFLLEPDGTERWANLQTGIFAHLVKIDAEGDVQVYGSTGSQFKRVQYAAADGAYIDESVIEIPATAAAEDGSFIGVQMDDFSGFVVVASYHADGTRKWVRDFEVLVPSFEGGDGLGSDTSGSGGAVLASNGDVLVHAANDDGPSVSARVRRLDAKTGDTRDDFASCENLKLIGADATHYYVVGRPGAPSVGIARFSL